jgi:crotonobetainyl-CoA:carnitine CoA-transferase CaiB-like acyl-CoA transferase
MQRMGLDAETLRKRSPGLVYCSISGWGQEGPWAERAAYAPLVQAEAGTLALGGRLRRGPMRGEILQHADLYAGLMAANSILSALFYRERTGEGQHLDVSMGETLLFVNEHAAAELSGFEGSRGFETWDFETFELGDGSFVHLLGSPVQIFPLLGAVLGMQEALADARFVDEASRFENRSILVEVLADRLREVPTPDALSSLLEGTPAIAIPVRTTAELGATDWATERGVVREVAPGLRVPVAPFRSDRVEVGIVNAHVAHRGENNRAVLKDWLDLSDERIERLTTDGALLESESEPASLAEAPRRAFRPAPNESKESSS